jgi:uncharacterized delta-60 repeat protein
MVQPDGKILLSGSVAPNGWAAYSIARINADGSTDSTFTHPASPRLEDIQEPKLALQPDGKILLGGGLNINVTQFRNVIRLNSDGSADSSFTPPMTNGEVFALALQTDGKLLVGGRFSEVNGQTCGRLVRLL